jgi:hypothetical protein
MYANENNVFLTEIKLKPAQIIITKSIHIQLISYKIS